MSSAPRPLWRPSTVAVTWSPASRTPTTSTAPATCRSSRSRSPVEHRVEVRVGDRDPAEAGPPEHWYVVGHVAEDEDVVGVDAERDGRYRETGRLVHARRAYLDVPEPGLRHRRHLRGDRSPRDREQRVSVVAGITRETLDDRPGQRLGAHPRLDHVRVAPRRVRVAP